MFYFTRNHRLAKECISELSGGFIGCWCCRQLRESLGCLVVQSDIATEHSTDEWCRVTYSSFILRLKLTTVVKPITSMSTIWAKYKQLLSAYYVCCCLIYSANWQWRTQHFQIRGQSRAPKGEVWGWWHSPLLRKWFKYCSPNVEFRCNVVVSSEVWVTCAQKRDSALKPRTKKIDRPLGILIPEAFISIQSRHSLRFVNNRRWKNVQVYFVAVFTQSAFTDYFSFINVHAL